MDTNVPTLDTEIERTLKRMEQLEPDSEDYGRAVRHLEDLLGMKNKTKVSPDMIASIIANLFSIVLILNYEQLNVISTKAFPFIRRTN